MDYHQHLFVRPRARKSERMKYRDRSEAINLVLNTVDGAGDDNPHTPRRLLLLRPDRSNQVLDQLFIDKIPVPRESWSFDPHDRILSWSDAHGGGHLFLSHDSMGGHGNLGDPLFPRTVQATATTSFLCDVALNCGAKYVTSGSVATSLQWDPNSAAWQAADWVKQRLRFTYEVTPPGPFGPGSIAFTFEDLQTSSPAWTPDVSSSVTFLTLVQPGSQQLWELSFKSTLAPDPDSGSSAPVGPDTVFPWWLQATENLIATSITGAMQIDNVGLQGVLVGIRGVRTPALASGYFRVAPGRAPVGVFDGRLEIGGEVVPSSRLFGSCLSWTGLSDDHQERTGLPYAGSLRFNADGSAATAPKTSLRLRRLTSVEAQDALLAHRDLHPALIERLESARSLGAQDKPKITGLLMMTPFLKGPQGYWSDTVQGAVMQDMTDIMSSAIPADMWNLVYPNTPQPTLSGELAVVANSPVTDVADPAGWYHQLGTAVMTQGLAGGSDAACKYLNKPRASAWLQTEVAASKVYYAHSQLLFQYEWAQRFPLISDYQQDQTTNAADYALQIAQRTQVVIAEIKASIVADPNEPDMITKMIAQVQAVADYATTNKLYWAFAFYTYNTSPGILANISAQIGEGASADGSMLTRMFQTNVSILTALDTSGYFAKQYTLTINTFLTTNILTNMYGFTGDATEFSLIKQYLQEFVVAHLQNPDPQIAAAVAQIQQIMADEQADAILQTSITAIKGFADATQELLALPYIADRFVSWFKVNYPRFSAASDYFGTAVMGGLTAMATMNLILQFKDWDRLSKEEKASLVTSSVQLGIQFLAAMVKRGVRISKIFGVEGLTGSQRAASVFKIVANGEGGELEAGLVRTGNSAARWLSSADGTAQINITSEGIVNAILINDAEAAVEDAGLVGKLLGKNLDEFVATRLGPVFILAGIGFSAYSIIKGDKGPALAGDILGIVSGALSIFAMAGGWAIGAGIIAAEGGLATIVSIAGPLAIVAALAGVGFMIYEMLDQTPPPDPIQEFVDNYAAGAGFSVRNKNSSIDYAYVYANPDADGLLMIGISLTAPGGTLKCGMGGVITVGEPTTLPDSVWQSPTDGIGLSKFIAVAPLDAASQPVALYLTLMDDDSISFTSKMPPPSPAPNRVRAKAGATGGPNPVTQTWLTAATGDASLTSDGAELASLPLTVRPVPPDASGAYAPSQAEGWLALSGTKVAKADQATGLTLTMSGMAPNDMTMENLSFPGGSVPDPAQKFAPRFGVIPSSSDKPTASIAFTLTHPLPSFLNFDKTTGTIAPNRNVAVAMSPQQNTISASNRFGSAQADFSIGVTSPSGLGRPQSGQLMDLGSQVELGGNVAPGFKELQMQFVSALKGASAASAQAAEAGMLPALRDALDGLPFYQAPGWTNRLRNALAQVLALNLPNPTMVYYSTLNRFANYTAGYKDAFYAGVGASDTTNAVISMTAATAPALNNSWWVIFAQIFLTDAVRLHYTSQLPIHLDALASDMASYNSQLVPGLRATVTAVLQNGYPPTTQPLGLLLDKEDVALEQLTMAIASGTFTANVNQAIQSGGDAATAATWFLYELWLFLALFRATNVDTLITQFEGNGLTVPVEVGPGNWQTYSTWFPPLTGNDVLPVAVPWFNAIMLDVVNPPYHILGGYSKSMTIWGPLRRYWP